MAKKKNPTDKRFPFNIDYWEISNLKKNDDQVDWHESMENNNSKNKEKVLPTNAVNNKRKNKDETVVTGDSSSCWESLPVSGESQKLRTYYERIGAPVWTSGITDV